MSLNGCVAGIGRSKRFCLVEEAVEAIEASEAKVESSGGVVRVNLGDCQRFLCGL